MCGGTCPPLLFGALPVTPGSEDAWPPWRSRAHGASPRSLPWVPRLRTRLPLFPSSAHAYSGVDRVGGLTAVRPCARLFDTALPAPSTLPTVRSTTSGHRTAGSQARRLHHLRASRSPSRQIGGRLLRCRHSHYPGASADSLTRHATPAVSSCCTTLPPHHWSLGPSRYAFCRSAIPRFTHSPTRRGPAAAAQHSPGRVLSLSLRQ